MTELNQVLSSIPTLLFTAFVEYRFMNRIFERRLPMPVMIITLLVVDMASGWLNLTFHIAGTIPGNEFYYCCITFLAYLLLFKGSKIKILFFTVAFLCISGILIHMALPFCYGYGGDEVEKTVKAINAAAFLSMIVYGVYLEYMGRRFENLKYELPKDYMVYLMVATIFVYMAVFAMQEVVLMRYNGQMNFAVALGCVLFATVGIILVIAAVFAVERQSTVLLRQQQSKMQMENFKSREEEWRRIAGFKHDFKNHLICLSGLLGQGRTGEAEAYLTKLSDTVEQLENKVHTGNGYADVILGAKHNEALAKNIKISMDMILPAEMPVEPADLCCILSNVMDNAIEECIKLPQEERWISMRSFIQQRQMVMEVKNSLAGSVKISNGKILTDKPGKEHGFGIDNVRSAVEKYGGVMDITAGEWFTFSMMLPMNRS